MKMFWQNRQQTQPVIPPELQPYYGDHPRLQGWKRWALPVAIVLALLIVAIVIWIVVGVTTPDKTSNTPGSHQPPQHNPTLQEKPGQPTQTPSSGKTNTKPIEL